MIIFGGWHLAAENKWLFSVANTWPR
jgi:hypothetical protein